MDVLDRPYFKLIVIAEPLNALVRKFKEQGPSSVLPAVTPFVFPNQPYTADPDGAPMIMWSPSCSPHLTAFMPHIQSGDYFVVQYAHKKMMLGAASIRSTLDNDEWPINEFIVHADGARKRIVRAMRDSPRWDFFADGAILPFEDETKYSARRIRDRLSRSDLIKYVEAWGAPVSKFQFWTTESNSYTFAKKQECLA